MVWALSKTKPVKWVPPKSSPRGGDNWKFLRALEGVPIEEIGAFDKHRREFWGRTLWIECLIINPYGSTSNVNFQKKRTSHILFAPNISRTHPNFLDSNPIFRKTHADYDDKAENRSIFRKKHTHLRKVSLTQEKEQRSRSTVHDQV